MKFISLSKNALGMLISRYRAVLRKMLLKNLAALLTAGMFLLPAPAAAEYEIGGPNFIYPSLAELHQTGITFQDNDTIIVPFNSNGWEIYLNNASATRANEDFSNYNQLVNNNPGGVAYLNNSSTLNLQHAKFANNKATLGGAVYLNNNSKIIFTDGEFINNTANNGGAAYLNNHSTFEVSQISFNNNQADNSGGAVYLYNNGKLDFLDGKFTDNLSHGIGGGAAYLSNNSVLTFRWAEFNGNRAVNGSGGAAYLDIDSTLTVLEASLVNNHAAQNGGAVYLNNGSKLTTDYAGLAENSAGENGGAVYLDGGSSMTAENAGLNQNSAGKSGGAVYINDGSTLKFKYGSLDGNSAGESGGAVYINSGGKFDADGINFTNNNSSRNGGAVVVESATFSAANSMFTNNTASNAGGAVYVTANNGDSILNLNSTAGQSTLFSGNKAGNSSNSVHFSGSKDNTAILNITGVGTLDMLDAINSSAGSYNIAVAKTGNGIWKLAGDNKFNAAGSVGTAFIVGSGILELDKDAKISIAKGKFSLEKDAAFIFHGNNAISAENINFAKDSTLDFDLTGRTTGDPYLLMLDGATVAGTAIGNQNIDIMGNLEINKTGTDKVYKLITGTSGVNFTNTGNLTYNGESSPEEARHLTALSLINNTANSLELKVSSLQNTDTDLTWTGNKDEVWDELGRQNWFGTVGGKTVRQFLNGDVVSFLDSGKNKDITVQSAGVEVGGMKVNNSAGNAYRFDGGTITNTGKLLKEGSGILTIGNMETQSVLLSGGELIVADGKTLNVNGELKTASGTILSVSADENKAAIKAGSVVFDTGSIINVDGYSGDKYGESAVTLIESNKQIDTTDFRYTIGNETNVDYLSATVRAVHNKIVADLGLTWYSQNNAHGTFTLERDLDYFIVGTVLENRNGVAGWDGRKLTKAGSGTLALAGANTYDGGTDLKGGRLEIGHNQALGKGAVTMAANTELGFLGNHSVVNNIAINGAATVDTQSFNAAISGVISGGGSLTKSGQGTLTLSGANTYTGDTNLNAGRINIGNNNALGNSGALMMADGTTLGFVGDYSVGNEITLAPNTTVDTGDFKGKITGNISGGGGLEKTGAGTLSISGNNSYAGGTFIEQGTLEALSGNALSSGKVEIKNDATLALVFTGEFSNDLHGEGTLTTNGNITIKRANSNFSGNTSIEAGVTTLETNGALGANGIKIKEGATLNLTFGGDFDNELSGGGIFKKSGGGTLAITGDNSFFYGVTNLEAGRVNIGNANALGRGGTLVMSDGTTLGFTGGYAVVGDVILHGKAIIESGQYSNKISGNISGAGNLFKTGNNTLTLSGVNDYQGGTVIDSGKIVALNAAALGGGGVVNNTGLELKFDGDFENNLSGGGSLTTNGKINIKSSNAGFSGTTTIEQGNTSLSEADSLGSGKIQIANNAGLTLGFDGELANELIGGGSLTIGGNVSINKGNSSFNGGVTISQGKTTLGNVYALNKSDIDIRQGAVLSLGFGGDFNNTLSGAGTLAKSTPGTVTINGNNSHSGGTKLEAGRIDIGNANALGKGLITMSDGTTLGFAKNYSLANDLFIDGTATIESDKFNETISGDISGGTLRKTGGGILTLEGTNSYTGGTIIETGKIIAKSVASMGRGNITNNADLNFDLAAGNSGSFDKNISGSGNLIKDGLGALILGGVNDYQGSTTVRAGSLTGNIADNTSLILASEAVYNTGSGSRTLASLDGRGTVNMQNNDLTVGGGDFGGGTLNGVEVLTKQNSSGIFTVGNATVKEVNLNEGELVVTDGKTLNISGELKTEKDTFLTVSANANQVAINAGSVNFDADSTINVDGYNGTTNGTSTVVLINSGEQINTKNFKYTIGHETSVDYLTATVRAEDKQIVADIGLSWYSQTAAHGTFTLAHDIDYFIVGAVLENRNGSANMVNGWDGRKLTKAGTGTLALAGANTYDGGTDLKGGRLEIGHNQALGKGVVTMAANTGLGFLGNHSIANNIVLNGAAGIDTQTFDTTISGVISGGGSLTKTGQGALTLSGANTYTGNTNLNEGRVNIGNNNALGNSGTLMMADGTTLGFADGYSLGNKIQMNGRDAIFDTDEFSAAISGKISGTSHLTKEGAGILTLEGINDYTGGTLINEGTLVAKNIQALGSDGGVDIAGNALLQFDVTGANNEFSQEITGKGSLGVAGNVSLTGNNSYTGGTNISGAGILSVTNTLALGSGKINLAGEDSAVEFKLDKTEHETSTLANEISGSGSLIKSGDGTLTLTGNNSHGNTNLIGGRINAGSENALGSGALIMGNNTTLGFEGAYSLANKLELASGVATIENNFATELSGRITGGGTLLKSGTGTLTLSGVGNAYTGGTLLREGRINVGGENAFGTGLITMENDTTVGFFNSYSTGNSLELKGNAFFDTNIFDNTLTGRITGGGALHKLGSGTLVLTGDNNYQGGTVIDSGTLVVKNTNALGSGENVNIKNNGLLNFFIEPAAGAFSRNSATGSDIFINSYHGTGVIGIQASLTESENWSDVLNFNETPESVNIHFNFTPNSKIAYLKPEGLKFAVLANGGGEDTFLIDGYGSLPIGANELTVVPDSTRNEYYLQSLYNNSLGEVYSEISTIGLWEAANMHDLTLFNGIGQASLSAADNSPGIYAGIEKSDTRHHIGSSADINGNKLLLALAWRNKENSYGIFGQKFNGNYKTDHMSFLSGGKNNLVHSSGDLRHHDFGLFFKRQKDNSNHYYTAVLKAGRSGNDFSSYSEQGVFSTFQTGRNLFGLSVGGGYTKNAAKNVSSQYYTHLIYTHLGGDDITDSIGQEISFDSADSFRILSGLQFNLNQNKKTRAFIGAALDYEFKGKTKAIFTNGNEAATSSLKGLTGILELGFSSRQSNSLTIEGTIRGFVGKKEGFGGTLALSKKF